jgi:hypothetical protein
MDWARAIEINQSALTRIVAALIALVGLAAGGAMARLPRPVYRAALNVLRPAESAVRRLIVIAAQGVVVKLHAVRAMPAGLALSKAGSVRVSFQLFDARRRSGVLQPRSAGPKVEPRVFVFGANPLVPLFQPQKPAGAEAEPGDGMAGAERLGRRLQAIKMALENVGAQVKRLARWQARRDRMANPKFRSPLRPGLPPGHRNEPREDIDRTLSECHALARDALKDDSS